MNNLSGPCFNYDKPLKNPDILSSKIIKINEDNSIEEYYDFTSNNLSLDTGLSIKCLRIIEDENNVKYIESIYNFSLHFENINTNNFDSSNINLVGNILFINHSNLDYRYLKMKHKSKSKQKKEMKQLNNIKFEFTLSNNGIQKINNIINSS